MRKKNFSLAIIGMLLVAGGSTVELRKNTAQSAAADTSGNPAAKAAPKPQWPLNGLEILSSEENIDKQRAVWRAETILRDEKVSRLASTGQAANNQRLAAESYTPLDVIIEADGSEHVRMGRKLLGLPVIGGGIVVHSREGRLLSTTRTLDLQMPNASNSPQPQLPRDQAVLIADKYFRPEMLREPVTTIVYYARDNRPVLAYEVEFLGSNGNGIPANDLIYVDADRGAYLGRDSKIHTAVAAQGKAFTLFRGQVEITTGKVNAQQSPEHQPGYVLMDPSRGGGRTLDGGNALGYEKVINAAEDYMESHGGNDVEDSKLGKPYFDPDNLWGTNQIDLNQRVGAEVQYGLAKTWEYFKQRHDRSGLANDGKGLRAVANIASSDQEFTNAFWTEGLNTMFYLNGSAEENSNPVIEIDVAGHEMSHGITASTARLLSDSDSGGLNEATSDIFGTMVEFFDDNAKDPPDYLMGENIFRNGKPYRYMFKPSLDSHSGPDGRQYSSYDCYPKEGFNETVDEHFSSGVGNHFFYLLSEGAVVPRSHRSSLIRADLVCNGNTALRGITNKLAAQVWYRALTLYMVEQTTYPQAREATQQAAADLHARGLLTNKQADAVACAWDAVNVALPNGSRQPGCRRL